jgi:hypothetical protein
MQGYTNIDKAIVALIMAAIQLTNVFFPNITASIHVDQNVVASIVAALTPVLVWAWPNAPKDA